MKSAKALPRYGSGRTERRTDNAKTISLRLWRIVNKIQDSFLPLIITRVLTRFYYSHIKKNAPPLGSYFFQATIIIFELIQDIIETNLLTKFHEDWKINPYKEKCLAPGGHVFNQTKTIFELIQEIIETNLLTKFHED
ncbi:hypothetical protein DPMN_175233 [Dreissena polymorpha]|uniref:Uncharacterized protein n=1 Tax=Dreissena polymorpha TaxID=45954 RepID=A0A9D4E4U2_DREPO|nr:hypothetical protein DPMN_175233 [Dreissena polymorpha]